jgi:hypothetical protein
MRRLAAAIVALAVLAAIVVIATGAFQVRSSDDTINVTIDKKHLKDEAERGAENAREAGSKLLRRTGEALEKAGGKIRSTTEDRSPQEPSEKAPGSEERMRKPGEASDQGEDR